MMWYDPLLIFVFFIGILFFIFGRGDNKRNVIIGLALIFLALIIRAFLWFESTL